MPAATPVHRGHRVDEPVTCATEEERDHNDEQDGDDETSGGHASHALRLAGEA
jgi:hypothetical protein